MEAALSLHRFQFAFTASFHYLFPQLSMGLALILLIFKTLALARNDPYYDAATRFWARIFGLTFLMGVVTGIPLEFQFGTNWAKFSHATGSIIGQTLAMEGVFAFFLESAFLGLFLFGEKKLSPKGHWFVGFLLFFGSWLSAYFIICTNAWMHHPLGYNRQPDGTFHLASFGNLLLNPWAFWQFAHTMCGAVVTGSFAVACVGAHYLLLNRHVEHARRFLRVSVVTGAIGAVATLFPTGDEQGLLVAKHQPAALAAMEGLFHTESGADLVMIGQPNLQERRLDNPIAIPNMLSFLTYRRWQAQVRGLDSFPESDWPTNIPLLFYSYHIMIGLGTVFIAIMLIAFWKLVRGTLFQSRPILWVLLLSLPFPFIANTAGWMTAELGRQPWLVYGLMRTSEGASPQISSGNAMFTLLGFMGLYAVMSLLYVLLGVREIIHGPAGAPHAQNSREEVF